MLLDLLEHLLALEALLRKQAGEVGREPALGGVEVARDALGQLQELRPADDQQHHADHQRYHPVGQTYESRHYRAEYHNQRMHGRHLIKERGINKLQARLEQFGPDDHDHHSTDKKHQQRKHQVHRTDIFVIG